MKKWLLAALFFTPLCANADASTTVPIGPFCGTYAPLVEQYSWNPIIALYVMNAESGCYPYNNNLKDDHGACRGSYGLFQIGCESGIITDPVKNVAMAYELYKERGWEPWSSCFNGRVICQ